MILVCSHLQKYKPIIIVPTFSFVFCRLIAQSFHRFDDGEGSRSVAERFVIVSKTKTSTAYLQYSVVTFHVANIVTVGLENRVIYQLNIGAFTPEGTFKAAQEQLGRLDTLGIDILWLMPIYPRGETMHSPYASMNFKAVNPAYGTVADVKEFVAAAHDKGMKVWLDWVPNHVAVENPWVKEHPEYFTKDEKGQMIHPHGWGDVFELNYQNEELVNEMNSAMNFWIDNCHVDGFRCDYVSSPTIPVKYWQDIIAELKSKGVGIEMLSETQQQGKYPHRLLRFRL